MKEFFDKAYILDVLGRLSSQEKEFLYILLEKKSTNLETLIEAGKKTIVQDVKDDDDALDKIKELQDKLKELKLIKVDRKKFNPELSLNLIKPDISSERKKIIYEIRDFWKKSLDVKRLPKDYNVKINFFLNHFSESQIRGAIFTACKRDKGNNPRYIYGILKKIKTTVQEKKEELTPKIKIQKEKSITQKQVRYIHVLLKANETSWSDLGYKKNIENLNMQEAQDVIEKLGGGDYKKNSDSSKLFPDYS